MAEGGKSHRKPKAGRKADKRKSAEAKKRGSDGGGGGGGGDAARKRNPRAFVTSSRGKAKQARGRTAEKEQRRMHVPMVERPTEEPPPFTILVHGPPGVGKTTLIKGLIKHYTRQDIREVKGPVTLVAGKARRLTFIECPQDLNSMIDASKYADLVLLLVDGAFGFEMETFEFLNLLQVHGFPKVMGVLTHLDGFKDTKALKKTKKALKGRFWAEIYQGAKLFYLSGIKHGRYLKREILNLARFISVMKFRPLAWRQAHPFLVADRFEDVTPGEAVRAEPKCDRDVTVYGYLRGTNWKEGMTAHLAGVGDFRAAEVAAMPDPCPLPSQAKKRTLNEKERLVYAPMSDVGGLLYDRDAMYIDIPDWKVQFSQASVQGGTGGGTEGEALVRGLQGTRVGVDEKLERAQIQVFAGGRVLRGDEALWGAGAGAAGEEESESEEARSDSEDEAGGEEREDDKDEEDDEEEEDDDDESEEELGAGARRAGSPQQQLVVGADGRRRRRAIFPADGSAAATGAGPAFDNDTGSDSDEEAGDGEEEASDGDGEGGDESEEESEGASGEEESEEGLGGAARWKGSLLERASALFSARAADLQGFIYGSRATADAARAPSGRGRSADSDSDDELFRPRGGGASEGNGGGSGLLGAADAVDSSRSAVPAELLAAFEEPAAVEALRNRFVTGDWNAGEARAAARPGADGSDGSDADADGDAFGDFVDVETGQRFAGSDDPATRAAAAAIAAAGAEEALAAKRAAKKAAFDAEYDQGGAKAVDDALPGSAAAAGGGRKKRGAGGKRGPYGANGSDDEEGDTYYDAMKREMAARAERTAAAMALVDPAQRLAMEGHRPGSYVRVRFAGVPYELVAHFDPRTPLLVGGVVRGEEAPGYMQLRLKRHRWFPKTLKNRDPLVFSAGWRRFQSLPVFAIADNNGRQRMLKYTPDHMHCLATVWGPLAPPGTGVLAFQRADSTTPHWRIAATGVVLQLDASLRIVKKLKLVGTPVKVHRHTAFIGGMFNSQLEASKFEGASIRTVSGIRGTIKKAVRTGTAGAREGAFRATFEDKPLLSDTVFLRAWVAVDVPKFFTPVTNLLAARAAPAPREPKPRRNRKSGDDEEEGWAGQGGVAAAAAGPGAAAAAAAERVAEFVPVSKFAGRRAGFVYKLGSQGLGYYADVGTAGAGSAEAAQQPAAADANGGGGGGGTAAAEGWVGVRSVADLRREAGIGAPRLSDSLYRPVERAPRRFNPLRVPAALQAALPFKSKPKVESARKRTTLEQRRAVVLEPAERRQVTLISQLNAIRNAKAEARREQRARQQAKAAKRAAVEEAWRGQHNREERKKRYVERGQAEKRAAKKQNRGD